RRILALARHADDAANSGDGALGGGERAWVARGSPSAILTRRSRLSLPCEPRLEVVVRDRIFEFLPEEPLGDEHVEAGRKRLESRLIQPDRADVLLPAKHHLRFLLPLRFVPPHGHDGGQDDRHHANHHEQGRHRVARVAATPSAALTLSTHGSMILSLRHALTPSLVHPSRPCTEPAELGPSPQATA